MGRPTKYRLELATDLCTMIALGRTTREACAANKITTPTLFEWLAKYESFASLYARAKEIAMEGLADEIMEISDDITKDKIDVLSDEGEVLFQRTNHEAINRSRLRVDTRKWLMSKLAPKKWGDRTQHDVGGELIVNINLTPKPKADAGG